MISRAFLATIIALSGCASIHAGESFSGENERVEINSVDRLVCPDESVDISMVLRTKKTINGKDIWVRTGGKPLNVYIFEDSNSGGSAGNKVFQRVTTGANTGQCTVSIETGSVVGKSLRVWVADEARTARAYIDILVVSIADKDKLQKRPAAEALHDAITDLQEAEDKADLAGAAERTENIIEKIIRENKFKLPRQSTNAANKALAAAKQNRVDLATFDFTPLFRLRDFCDGQLFQEAEIDRRNLSKKEIDEVVQIIKNLKLKPIKIE